MNAYKNEKLVTVGGVEILLRPNFENISSYESSVMTVDEFAFRLVKGKLPSMTDTVKTIFFFQAEKKFNLEEINQLVQADGGLQVSQLVVQFMSGVAAGAKNLADNNKVPVAMTADEKKS